LSYIENGSKKKSILDKSESGDRLSGGITISFFTDAYYFYVNGLPLFLDLSVVAFLVLGTIIGLVIGILPGLTSTMGLAVFTPLTFGMEINLALIFLVGIYVGSVYSGSITSILINIPGTPGAIVTGLEGYPMTLRGESGRAIGISASASLIGGMVGIVFLVFFAPAISKVALKFDSIDYVALAFLGLSMVSYISGKSVFRGVIGVILGLLMASIGADPMTGYARFTFNQGNLYGGLAFIPVLIGLFGLPEILDHIKMHGSQGKIQRITKIFLRWKDLKKIAFPSVRGGLVGSAIGAIPFASGAISVIINYALERMFAKKKDRDFFGKGYIPALAAPEASNNASIGGALVPLLTLGIPGDPMTAVLLGAFLIHGITPGPMLFVNNAEIMSSIFIANTICTAIIFVIGITCAKYLAKLISIPQRFLGPVILMFCLVGSYAINNSLFDMGVFVIVGILGYFLRKVGVLAAPMILGFILGPMFEENLRRSLIVSGGVWSVFFTRISSLVFIIIGTLMLFSPIVLNCVQKKRLTK